MFHNIKDSLLIQTYEKAIEFNLNEEFISLLVEEIEKRGIQHMVSEMESIHVK
jgi:hypothetical protein